MAVLLKTWYKNANSLLLIFSQPSYMVHLTDPQEEVPACARRSPWWFWLWKRGILPNDGHSMASQPIVKVRTTNSDDPRCNPYEWQTPVTSPVPNCSGFDTADIRSR